MNASIVTFQTPEQAQVICYQYLRDDYILVNNSILVDNLTLAAVEFAAQVESFFLQILPNAWAFTCSVTSPQEQRQFALNSRTCVENYTPKIYVACLSAYSAGYLHGTYIDATQDPEDIREQIQEMLSTSPVADIEACEDWAIHDYQNFAGITLHEYESIDYVSALANAIEEHGTPFALYIDYLCFSDVEEAISNFEDNYNGCFESVEDYVQDYYEQTGQLEAIEKAGLNSFYINWKAIAHDWECNSDLIFLEESHNEIHVFYNH